MCTQSWLKDQHGGLKLDDFADETHAYEFLEEDTEDKIKEKDHGTVKIKTNNINVIDV